MDGEYHADGCRFSGCSCWLLAETFHEKVSLGIFAHRKPRKLLGLCFGERGFLYDFAVAVEVRRTFLVITGQTKSSNLLPRDNKR